MQVLLRTKLEPNIHERRLLPLTHDVQNLCINNRITNLPCNQEIFDALTPYDNEAPDAIGFKEDITLCLNRQTSEESVFFTQNHLSVEYSLD